MIYANLPMGSAHGWGVCGKYISRELARLEPVRLIAPPFSRETLGDESEYEALHALELTRPELERFPLTEGVRHLDGPLLQAIANQTLAPMEPNLRGTMTVGYTFFEFNLLEAEWLEQSRRHFHRVATGSSWCTQILGEAGLKDVATVIQGVDPALFSPTAAPDEKREFGDKFVVFSGGKFELRKGQDIVIRAFKVLQDRHPDVVLVNAWFNPWPQSMRTMQASKLIRLAPKGQGYVEFMNSILIDNGIDVGRVLTLPSVPNRAMGRLYRSTDVGLFPNRCEGGTNLVLMEYMACGKPVVAVNSTGHADVINAQNAVVIHCNGAQTISMNGRPAARWPEPDLEDAIAKLEWAYQNRDALRRLGQQAARDMASRTWQSTARDFQCLLRGTTRHGEQ